MALVTENAPATGAPLVFDSIAALADGLVAPSKLAYGAEGLLTLVSTADRLPVQTQTGLATEAKQDDMIAAIENISPGGGGGGDASAANQLTLIGLVDGVEAALATLGTQTTLAAILAKLIAAPATEAKQDTLIGHVDGIETLLTSGNSAQATAANQTTIIGHVDGIETSLTSILAKIIAAPATEAKQDAQTAAIATIGTRAYGAGASRVAYTGTSAQSGTIAATEVMLHNCGTARCYVAGASNPTATVNDIPLEAGEKFTMRITSGHKVAVIQDSTGGNLNIIPVA